MAETSRAAPDALCAGAETFRTLLRALHAETERQLVARRSDVEAGVDVRDYQQLAMMINEAIPLSLDIREGFMRALADVLACFADGATFNIDEPMRLDPIGGGCATAALTHVDTSKLRKIRRKPGRRDIGDAWFGTAEAIIAAGLARLDELPGQPGRPKASVAYRPAAGKQGADLWDRAPGYRSIKRCANGFRIDVTASEEEQIRRTERSHAPPPISHARAVLHRLRLVWSASS